MTGRGTALAFAAALCLGFGNGAAAESWTETAATLGSDDGALHGTLTLPDGGAAADAVLIQAGAGPSDRNGNLPGLTSNALALLARALGERGIASLRTDKRGTGESAAASSGEAGLSPSLYARDVAAWTAWLKQRPRVRRVFLAGHSEGALIVTLAARTEAPAGLILLAGAGHRIAEIIRRQLAAGPLPAPLREEADRIIASLEAGRLHPNPNPALYALFRESVQPYLIEWFRYDPAGELAKTGMPALAVQGTTDLQIDVADAERLAAARPGVDLKIVDGMNHMLKRAPTDPYANIATYNDPDLPVMAELVDAIAAFVGR
ncbi:MAG: alpha/beta fold hydrolase [Rhodospirillaceae bacterium]